MTCKNCISFHVCGKPHRREFFDEEDVKYICKHFNDKKLINRQKAEIERLQTKKDNLIKTYKECQVEVIKEFAERLKAKEKVNHLGDGFVYAWDITKTYEEMVGEQRREDEGK